MTSLKLAGAALNQTPLDWKSNYQNIIKAIKLAQEDKVDILCLPELCITGYGCEDVFLSSWIYERAISELTQLLPLCHDILVCVGLPLLHDNKRYNATCIIQDTEIKGFYVKHHLAKEGVHYEPRWFSSWPLEIINNYELSGASYPIGQLKIDYKGIDIGFEICEDAWKEERPVDHLGKVDLILNPSASHFAFGKAKYREELVVKSSEKYKCVYLYTNLLGNEAGKMIYDGDIIVAQKGVLKGYQHRLSFKDVQMLALNIDFQTPSNSDHVGLLDSQDKYDEFPRASALGLFDYLRKSRSGGFVLSLSGGADSSTIAVMVAEMKRSAVSELGEDAFWNKIGLSLNSPLLHTAYQGTRNSSEETFNSAQQLAKSIDAIFYHWSVDKEVNGYREIMETVLNRKLSWQEDDIALQNIQARTRSPIIWMLTNIKNCLLLTTSNRSEGDVGYATMDGDTSGSIAPIAGVDKDFIKKWLVYAEQKLGYTALRFVNNMEPTAELRPSEMEQKDEKDLMPYDLMVKIERLAIKEWKSPEQVLELLAAQNLSLSENELQLAIDKFFRLWTRNQWKRERIAPAFQLDDFNVDPRSWCRFPILSGGFDKLSESQNIGSS